MKIEAKLVRYKKGKIDIGDDATFSASDNARKIQPATDSKHSKHETESISTITSSVSASEIKKMNVLDIRKNDAEGSDKISKKPRLILRQDETTEFESSVSCSNPDASIVTSIPSPFAPHLTLPEKYMQKQQQQQQQHIQQRQQHQQEQTVHRTERDSRAEGCVTAAGVEKDTEQEMLKKKLEALVSSKLKETRFENRSNSCTSSTK